LIVVRKKISGQPFLTDEMGYTYRVIATSSKENEGR